MKHGAKRKTFSVTTPAASNPATGKKVSPLSELNNGCIIGRATMWNYAPARGRSWIAMPHTSGATIKASAASLPGQSASTSINRSLSGPNFGAHIAGSQGYANAYHTIYRELTLSGCCVGAISTSWCRPTNWCLWCWEGYDNFLSFQLFLQLANLYPTVVHQIEERGLWECISFAVAIATSKAFCFTLHNSHKREWRS